MVHKQADKAVVKFDAAKRAQGGLPACVFCQRNFDTFNALQVHIERDRCQKSPWMLGRHQPGGMMPEQATGATSLPKQGQPVEPPPHAPEPIIRDAEALNLIAKGTGEIWSNRIFVESFASIVLCAQDGLWTHEAGSQGSVG